MSLLEQINSPEALRNLDRVELKQVASELRSFILNVISEKGGHLASNLGSVELTVGLHAIFETPEDKIVWDVGHQAYGHKVLTGRRDQFHTIRQFSGLSGFTSRAESPYDHFGAGHASTSISAAVGIAEGMRQRGDPHMGIAVIGDGSLTGGLVYEALNNAGHIPVRNLLVVVNDNEMSIDPNVGALARFVNKALTSEKYNLLRKEVRDILTAFDEHGLHLAGLASKVRKGVKGILSPGMLFECLGFRYFGPINGHNLEEVLDTFSFIKKEGPDNGPYLVHALTVKGKGYKLAEELPIKYHGVNPFKVEEGIKSSGPKKANYQDVFADTLIELAKKNSKVIAITAAMPSGTGLSSFQKVLPNQFYDVGIAEAHAVLFAAGLATEGFRPVAAIYSTFLQRAYDQVIHDVGLQNLPVVFAMDRAGLVGQDGATHQGAFDLTYLRAVPNFVVMAPKDENEMRHMLKTAIDHTAGPIAVRYPRGEVVGVPLDAELRAIPIGEAELMTADDEKLDVILVAVGFAVQTALEAQQFLRTQGLRTGVINARFIKPLDEELLTQWIAASGLIVTIEENTVCGGFGSAILELMARQRLQNEVLNIGLPDRFIDHASPKIQREITRLDGQGVAAQVFERLQKIGLVSPEKVEHPESGSVLTH